MISPDGPFNPFPGLRPFEPDEDHLFFGREKEIDDLLRRLRSSRFLSVVGTSGSGKSSLVRSGLIPALQSGLMAWAGSGWRIATLRPGADPIGHLAEALDAPDVLGTSGEFAETNRVLLEVTLRRGTLGIVDAVRQARIPPEDKILLVIDQFEELFRFRRNRQIENSRDEAIAFVKLLLEAAHQSTVPIYIVLTMRSDFIGECMQFPGLPETVSSGQYLVPRLTRDGLRAAITGPIAVAGGEIAPRLVLRLLNDVGDDQDQLPVLQHALMRTWDHWEKHRASGQPIDIADYEAVGTLQQALSLHAEEAFQETGGERNQQQVARLFKALTDTFTDPRGLRRPTSVKDLAAICEVSPQEIIQLIEIFRRAGRSFLMPPPKVALRSASMIDLSHESLMRCWTRLITWADEERVSAGVYKRLSQAAAWFEEGTAGLWRNPELELGLKWREQNRPTEAWAERYDSFFARAMDFLNRSEQERNRLEAERERERKKKLKFAWGIASFLGVLFLATAVLAFLVSRQNKIARANLEMAKQAVDQSLSSAGRQQAREGADVPQLEEFRRELLQKAMSFYMVFTKENPRNEELQNEAAWAHSRIGDANRLLGRNQEAVNEYDVAIAQFEKLAGSHPKKAEYRQALAYSYNWLGETLRLWSEQSRTPSNDTSAGAEKAYDSALHLQEDLHQANPQNTEYQQELARTYYNRGILYYDRQQLSESEADTRRAMQLLQPLPHTKSPGLEASANPDPGQELARTYNNLATLLTHEKRLPEAQGFYIQAISLHEELLREAPHNREYSFELAQFYDNLAVLQIDEQAWDLARRNNQKALDIIKELVSPGASLTTAETNAETVHGYILNNFREHSKNSPVGASDAQFQRLYANLAENYAEIAEEYLQSGSLTDARLALDSLGRTLPQVPGPERNQLENSYRSLSKELQTGSAQRE